MASVWVTFESWRPKSHPDSAAAPSRGPSPGAEMCWRLNYHFTEPEGDELLSKDFQGDSIFEASQMADFRMDRYGAEIKSEAKFGMRRERRPTPRSFVFDRPFLLYLIKPDATWPFFAMWVDNAELLRRFGAP